MKSIRLAQGVVHTLPQDMRGAILLTSKVHTAWEDITPLARNEWICWVTSAKQDETRARRMRIMKEKLGRGERRPCCFAGCPHREKSGH
ncbi:MAG: hypothetical protein RLZZ234_338 [Candidatus Parcubacteria bacterium]|jgi:uncharacterized protein YdeI (YjbR/CyaY-like superfamily)